MYVKSYFGYRKSFFPVKYQEASRRFRKLPGESGSPPRVPPRPKGLHGLRRDVVSLLGQAHKSLKAHAVGKGGKSTLVWKGRKGTRIPPPPPWLHPRAWRGCSPRLCTYIERGGGAPRAHTKPLAPLSLPSSFSPSFAVSVALGVAVPR